MKKQFFLFAVGFLMFSFSSQAFYLDNLSDADAIHGKLLRGTIHNLPKKIYPNYKLTSDSFFGVIMKTTFFKSKGYAEESRAAIRFGYEGKNYVVLYRPRFIYDHGESFIKASISAVYKEENQYYELVETLLKNDVINALLKELS